MGEIEEIRQPLTGLENLPVINDAERLVPKDFRYGREEMIKEAIEAVDRTPVFPGYPENGLKMTPKEYDDWVSRGRPVEELVGTPDNRPPYFCAGHPNLYGPDGQVKPGVVIYEGDEPYSPDEFEGEQTASDGSPLHPYFEDLVTKSTRGVPTGQGFYYHIGGGKKEGNRWNKTADPVIVRLCDGFFQVAMIKRSDGGGLALPGGMQDPEDKGLSENKAMQAIKAAMREAGEEVGVEGLGDSDPEVILEDAPAGDWRLTAQAWPETTVVLFMPDDRTAKLIELVAGDDASAARWQTLKEGIKYFGSHESYINLAISRWQEKTGMVVGKDGRVGRPSK